MVALAVGIAATTAIYTVIQAVLLNPLPYEGAARYSFMFGSRPDQPGRGFSLSYFDYDYFATRVRTTEAFGCYFASAYNLTFNGAPLHVSVLQTTPSLMRALQAAPQIGRWFTDDESEKRSAVLSFALWERMGRDASVAGKSIALNGTSYTVAGVMPASFRFPVADSSDAWIPHDPDKDEIRRDGSNYLECIAKRRAEVSDAQLTDDLARIASSLATEFPLPRGAQSVQTVPVLAVVNQEIRPTLLLLLGAATALLLVGCANVASLLLARAVARERETAIRLSMGASLRALAAGYLSEGLLVAAGGVAAGVALSYGIVRGVLTLAAADIPRAELVRVDGRVLLFAVTAAILSSLLFSLAPLWQARRTSPRDVLADGARSTAGMHSRRLFRLFVISEIALASALAAVAAVALAQINELSRRNPGFDPSQTLALNMVAPLNVFGSDLTRYETRLLDSISAIPGVERAGFTLTLPMSGPLNGTTIWLDGRLDTEIGGRGGMSLMVVSDDYFRAMRVPLVDGRFFTAADGAEKTAAMILNQSAARELFAQGGGIGSVVRSSSWREPDQNFRIVGIVGDVRNISLAQPVRPEAYLSYRMLTFPNMAWAIRSSRDLPTLVRDVRAAAARVNPEQAIFDERPMMRLLTNSVARERLRSYMVGLFAISALVLTALGIYGVVMYSVRQRMVELGTRAALGATARDLVQLVVGDGLRMSTVGLAIGAIVLGSLGPVLNAAELGARTWSLVPLLAAAAGITLLCSAACLIPAWQASLVSPMVAIRNDPQSLWRQAREAYQRVAASLIAESEVEEDVAAESTLLAATVDASRQAGSFTEAIDGALSALRTAVGAESATLLVQPSAEQPFRSIAASPATTTGWELPPDLPVLRRLARHSSALSIATADLETSHRWAAADAPTHVAGIETMQAMGAALATTVPIKSGPAGVLILGRPIGRSMYSRVERKALQRAGGQLALLVENGRLTSRIVEQERLRREIRVASEVQKRLFPQEAPDTRSITCAGLCIPARGVGGDYYDFLDLGAGRTGLALADVSGKGIAAALVMSVVQASLRSLAETSAGSLANLAARMNHLLYRSTGGGSYATFFYAEYEEASRQLHYVNAGHNPPYLWRAREGSIEELPATGMVIGLFGDRAAYKQGSVVLGPGDVLMAFSDGLPEAHNVADEEFGEDRVKQLLSSHAHLPIAEVSSAILDSAQRWMAEAEQYDDLTFVLMKIR